MFKYLYSVNEKAFENYSHTQTAKNNLICFFIVKFVQTFEDKHMHAYIYIYIPPRNKFLNKIELSFCTLMEKK